MRQKLCRTRDLGAELLVSLSQSLTVWLSRWVQRRMLSVLNKISLLSLNCWVIATSLFLWSDQDTSLLPGIEMFSVMTCLAFLILTSPCFWQNNKKQKNSSSHWVLSSRCLTGSWCVGSTLVIVMVRNLDNFSNSLEQISCENKPLWENWKFIISYQWPAGLSVTESSQSPLKVDLSTDTRSLIVRGFPREFAKDHSDCWVGQFGLEDELWSCVIVLAGTKTRSYKIWPTKSIYY